MKKFIGIFTLLILVGTIHAQVRYSISGGVNITDLKNDWGLFENPNILPRFGYSLGGTMEIPVRASFYVYGQLALVSKNYAFDVEDFYGSGTVGYDRYSVLYLDLPICAGYQLGKFRFFLGPFFDYCLGGTNNHQLEYFNGNIDNGNNNISSSREYKSSEMDNSIFPLKSYNYCDAGIVFGIGHFNESYSIDLSHSYGLVNIFPKVEDNSINRADYSLYTRVFTLRLNIYL